VQVHRAVRKEMSPCRIYRTCVCGYKFSMRRAKPPPGNQLITQARGQQRQVGRWCVYGVTLIVPYLHQKARSCQHERKGCRPRLRRRTFHGKAAIRTGRVGPDGTAQGQAVKSSNEKCFPAQALDPPRSVPKGVNAIGSSPPLATYPSSAGFDLSRFNACSGKRLQTYHGTP
jgi:hypothetical protein